MPVDDFDDIYRNNVQRIYRYCLFRTNNREDAEDLSEEAFVRYLQNRAKVRGSHVVPWLYRVAHNLCADVHERKRAYAKAVGAIDVEPTVAPVWHDPSVWSALCALPAEQQQTIYLKAVEDRTFKEIARLTGRTQSAVKMSYYRGVRALAATIGE